MTTSNETLPLSDDTADASLPELLKTSSVTPLVSKVLSRRRKCGLVFIFCLAQFMDAFNISSVIPAIPAISHDLSMKPNETMWLFAAYGATFAAFLLIVSCVLRLASRTVAERHFGQSGRISDVYHPKPTFIVGASLLGVMSLGAGFVRNKVGMFALRAGSGIGMPALYQFKTLPSKHVL